VWAAINRPVAAADVDAYLAPLPEADRVALERVRKLIRAAAPDAEETVSYGIPLYKQDGHLIGFGAFKKHLSLFVTNSGVFEEFADELAPFECKGTTIHFSAANPLPDDLVSAIVARRIEENGNR